MEYWVIKMLISNILTYFSSKNINLMNCSKRYLCAHGFVSLLSPPCVRGSVLIWALCPGNVRGECLFLYPCDCRVSYLPSVFLSDTEILSVFGILPSVQWFWRLEIFFFLSFLNTKMWSFYFRLTFPFRFHTGVVKDVKMRFNNCQIIVTFVELPALIYTWNMWSTISIMCISWECVRLNLVIFQARRIECCI